MAMFGPMEMLLLLLMSAAGQPTDLVSLLSPQDYFQTQGIEVSTDKLVELAAKDPVDGATQLAQLLALRSLAEDGNFKKAANYQAQRQVVEDIAAGNKANDKTGFAKEYAQRALAQLDGVRPPAAAALGARADGLAWFPAAATVVAGIESRPAAMAAVSKSPAAEMLKAMPAMSKKEFYKVVGSLGNVRIERLTFAYVHEANSGRNYLRLTGRFNPAWVAELLKTTGMEAKERKNAGGASIIELGRVGRGPAIALIGDRDFVVAGSSRGDNDEEVLAQVLELREKNQANAAGRRLKTALDKIPAKAVGYLVGEFPEESRRTAGREFGAFPKSITAYIEKAAVGMDLIMHGTMDNDDQAKTFVETTSKLRMKGLDALQNPPPVPIPGINIDNLKNMLNSLQIEGQGATVSMRMLLSNDALNMLPYWMVPMRAEAVRPAQQKN
jgi:hypothetical protein